MSPAAAKDLPIDRGIFPACPETSLNSIWSPIHASLWATKCIFSGVLLWNWIGIWWLAGILAWGKMRRGFIFLLSILRSDILIHRPLKVLFRLWALFRTSMSESSPRWQVSNLYVSHESFAVFFYKLLPLVVVAESDHWLGSTARRYSNPQNSINNSNVQTIESDPHARKHKIPRAVLTSWRRSVFSPATRLGLPLFKRKGIVFFSLFSRPWLSVGKQNCATTLY